ncbi:membrane protein [Streptomyces finlayi]|uniref:Membrane protein n=1 Tax=Streptomyces finlayi TaxID=67296 RepID=A0A918X442_9ACTN|nr:membrane protein [Streptomyces finlayi]
MRVRLYALGAAAITIAAALGVRAVFSGSFAKYAGDALYTVLLYALVVAVAPRGRPVVAAAVALGISWAVEFGQLTAVPAQLSARSGLLRLVFGSTFNAPDLFWYVVGAAGAYGVHRWWLKRDRARLSGAYPNRPLSGPLS